MLICPKCNKEQEDGAKFCDACGAQIFETVFCPNCGEKTSTESAFCEQCGASIQEDVTVKTVSEGTAVEDSKKKGIGKIAKLPKKMLIGIGGAIAIVAVLIIVFAGNLFTGDGNKNYCLYLKDGEIVYDDFSEEGAFELTSRLLDNVSDYEIGINDGYYVSSYVKFSENGKFVFYPDRLDDESDGFTIYRRNLNKPNEEPVKIDSEVTEYEINNDGTQVIYLKEEGGLYSHNIEDKEKIASEVTEFYVANDCKKIGFLKSNGGYYIYNEGEENEKIASDVEYIRHISEDLSVVYYEKEEGLYRQVEGEDDVTKISSDVYNVEKIYDSGEIYYVKEDVAEIKLSDYVVDDIADADAAMTEPEYPDYPSWWDYDTDEAYDAAMEQYEAAYDAYEVAYEAYESKLERDALRATLQESTFEKSVYTLYYFDGEDSVVLTDALTDYYLPCAQDSPAIAYGEYNQVETTKVKLSEISSAYEVEDLVRAAMYSSAERYVAVGEKTSVLEQTDAQQVKFSADGKALYFLDDVSDEGRGDLYKAVIADAAVQKPELLDDDVDNAGVYDSKNTIAYFKNYDGEKYRGDLWINGKEVDYDVYAYNILIQDDTVYYYSDWNNEKEYGTLKMYANEETTKIADDVYSWNLNEGNILYLYDYSWNSYSGTLYIYKNGNSEKISDDVTCIIK